MAKPFKPIEGETVLFQQRTSAGWDLVVTDLRVVQWQSAPVKQIPVDSVANYNFKPLGCLTGGAATFDIQNTGETGAFGTNKGWIHGGMKAKDAEKAMAAISQARLRLPRAADPANPPVGLRSPDGNSWWDGNSWRPL